MPSSLSDFEVLHTIGSGSYGTCKKVKRIRDGKIFVWKEMDYGCMTETEKQMLVSEVNLLRELKHENIVRYHERIVDKRRQILYLVMEYCEGGDLAAVIKKYQRDGRLFEEDLVWRALAQCASALNECHKRKDGKSILHRDLKPANIFLDSEKNVKLGDFGLARVLHETSFAKTFVGTPYYMSPEQMNKLSYNEKSDIWSLGCVLYEMCTLRPPFLASNQQELAVKIRIGQFPQIPYRYSSALSLLINEMLSVECNKRPSIDKLLAHPRVAKHIKVRQDSTSSKGSSMEPGENKLLELSLRERRCKQKEDQLDAKEKELNLREKTLENLKRELDRRQMLLEKEMTIKKEQTGLRHVDTNVINRSKDLHGKPITPILCQFKKPDDSPSKRVSFQVQDKENDLVKIKSIIHDHEENAKNALMYEDIEMQKRKALRERLERAKQRANQLRAAETESRLRSLNILNIR